MDTLRQARKRFAELSTILKTADEVRDEWRELGDFLKAADRISGRLNPASTIPTAPTAETVRRTINATAIAEYVFERHGPRMHVNQVVEYMLENGWEGSGNPRKDYKNIHMLLSRASQFKALGKGMFERIEATRGFRG